MQKENKFNLILLNILVPVFVLALLIPALLVVITSIRVQGNVYSLDLLLKVIFWVAVFSAAILLSSRYLGWVAILTFLFSIALLLATKPVLISLGAAVLLFGLYLIIKRHFNLLKFSGLAVLSTLLFLFVISFAISLWTGFNCTFENYDKLVNGTKFIIWMKNTLFLCVMCSFLGVLAAATSGYAFSRFRFKGRTTGLLVLVLLQMFPAAMAMVAIFNLLTFLSNASMSLTGFNLIGINSYSGLILVYVGGSIPFNAWLIKSYIDSIPKELEESAYIDGCSPWRTFFTIIFPLMSPILIVVSIFNFITPYADFIFPSIVLMDESKYTLAVGMKAFILNNFSTNWSQFAAASVLGAIPILLIFFGLQKYLVEGLTKGAVKG